MGQKGVEWRLLTTGEVRTGAEALERGRVLPAAGNAVYSGPWVSHAKRYFSRAGCAAYQIGNGHLKGSPIRQHYLETAIKWISSGNIEDYMGRHQHDENARPLWEHFQRVSG